MKSISYFVERFAVAVEYSRAVAPKAARNFIAAFERAKQMISRFPKIGTSKGDYRYLPLKDFPYRVCYVEDLEGQLVLVTLFHYKQKEPHIS